MQHADDQAADDVDQQDDDAGHGIAAHELAGTIHRPVEIRLLGDFGTAFARDILTDQSRVQIGIDRHLLARHRVQRETRAYFGNPARALGDHDKIDHHQDREHHDADGIIAAHQKMPERLDHLPRRIGAGMPFQQYHAGRSDVQRQTQQGGDQQYGWKGGKIECPGGVHADQQYHHGDRDVESEQNIQQKRRQRQHHHRQYHHDQDRAGQAAQIGGPVNETLDDG